MSKDRIKFWRSRPICYRAEHDGINNPYSKILFNEREVASTGFQGMLADVKKNEPIVVVSTDSSSIKFLAGHQYDVEIHLNAKGYKKEYGI